MKTNRSWLFAVMIALTCSYSAAEEWSRFRGPNGSGVSLEEASLPAKWSEKENLKWKTPLPGPGVSSPIVIGDKLFVTCYSGYGVNRQDPGKLEDLKRHLVCVDASSGKIAWQKQVDAEMPEDPFTGIGVTAHGYASHTPVSDGERVYCFFGKSGVFAFDLDGKQLWQVSVGKESDPRRWGSSSSPVLYKNTVIVTASAESQALVALDKQSGKEVWRQEAAGLDNTWGTPAMVESDGEPTLVLGVPNEIWAFNPDNGKLRWYAEAMRTDQFNSSVLVNDGVVYAIEGRGGGSIAIRAGGKGDVTDSHVVWSGRDAARFGTPVALDGKMYFVSSGVMNCINLKDGKKAYQLRLPGAAASSRGGRGGADGARRPEGGRPTEGQGGGREGQAGGQRRGGFGGGRGGRGGGGGGGGGSDYASPIIADGKLFYLKGSGEMHVIQVGDDFKSLGVNRVTSDSSETFGGTPAVSRGRIFLRSNKNLYCVSEE